MPTLLEFLGKINIDAGLALREPLSRHTTLAIGGPADALVAPRDPSSLARLVAAAGGEGLPLFVLGAGANILVGDRGIRGLVVELRHLDGVRFEELGGGRTRMVAGAGATVAGLCALALSRGLSGLETFYGMPGSLGGSVYMNARCYEVEMADRLSRIDYLDPGGRPASREILHSEWSYKRSPFQPGGAAAGGLIVGACLDLVGGDRGSILATMLEKRKDREDKGQYLLPSAGSVFKNDRRFGKPTGRILDELGFRGRSSGGALVSSRHANIFVNAGGASALDLLALVEEARKEAKAALGIELEPEILFVGEA